MMLSKYAKVHVYRGHFYFDFIFRCPNIEAVNSLRPGKPYIYRGVTGVDNIRFGSDMEGN